MINHPNRATKRRVTPVAPPVNLVRENHDRDYAALLVAVSQTFAAKRHVADNLFCTTAAGQMTEAFLDSLPGERLVHTCHTCRRFLETFGGLAVVHETGALESVMWNPYVVPEFYRDAVAAMAAKVAKSRITDVFLSKAAVWGTPVTGEWHHFALPQESRHLHTDRKLEPNQKAAAIKENVRIVREALRDFTAPMLDQALRILEADGVSRAERFIAPAQWLRMLHERPRGERGDNILWEKVAKAPDGFCHPRASMIGTLLEDIAASLPFDTIKSRFDAKMHPLQYQRPQAPPSAGNIKAAEALVEKLGIARSLERRFARLDEIATIWTPRPPNLPASGGGVFGHLQPKQATPGVAPVTLPTQTMTWVKFKDEILQKAEQIELLVPGNGRFSALVTAEHADAPPILQWDNEDERNPVSIYTYYGFNDAGLWGLKPGTWTTINAVSLWPCLWGTCPVSLDDKGALLVIDGCADQREPNAALFPEILKAELRGVRATIEAYSKAAKMGGREAASACGLSVQKSGADCSLRVLRNGVWDRINIDRWD